MADNKSSITWYRPRGGDALRAAAGKATAGLAKVMAAYRRVDDLQYRDQLRVQRSTTSMGSLYLYLYLITTRMRTHLSNEDLHTITINLLPGSVVISRARFRENSSPVSKGLALGLESRAKFWPWSRDLTSKLWSDKVSILVLILRQRSQLRVSMTSLWKQPCVKYSEVNVDLYSASS